MKNGRAGAGCGGKGLTKAERALSRGKRARHGSESLLRSKKVTGQGERRPLQVTGLRERGILSWYQPKSDD